MTRGRRRVIALSEADRRRLASGELARPEDALGEPEPPASEEDAGAPGPVPGRPSGDSANEPAGGPADDPVTAPASDVATGAPRRAAPPGRAGRARSRRPSAEDERLLREVPPHFGRL